MKFRKRFRKNCDNGTHIKKFFFFEVHDNDLFVGKSIHDMTMIIIFSYCYTEVSILM